MRGGVPAQSRQGRKPAQETSEQGPRRETVWPWAAGSIGAFLKRKERKEQTDKPGKGRKMGELHLHPFLGTWRMKVQEKGLPRLSSRGSLL